MQKNNPLSTYKSTIIYGVLGTIFYAGDGYVFAYIFWILAYGSFPIINNSVKEMSDVETKTINNAIIITYVAMFLFLYYAFSNFVKELYLGGTVALLMVLILYAYHSRLRKILQTKNSNTNRTVSQQQQKQNYNTNQQKQTYQQKSVKTEEQPKVYTESNQRNVFYNIPIATETTNPTTPPPPQTINIEVPEINKQTFIKKEEVDNIETQYSPAKDLTELNNSIKNLNAQPFVKAELNSVIRDLEKLNSNYTLGVKPIHFIVYGNSAKNKELITQIINDLFRLNNRVQNITPQVVSIHNLDTNEDSFQASLQQLLDNNKNKLVVIEDIVLENHAAAKFLQYLTQTISETTQTTIILNILEKDSSAIESLCRQNRKVQFRKLHIND